MGDYSSVKTHMSWFWVLKWGGIVIKVSDYDRLYTTILHSGQLLASNLTVFSIQGGIKPPFCFFAFLLISIFLHRKRISQVIGYRHLYSSRVPPSSSCSRFVPHPRTFNLLGLLLLQHRPHQPQITTNNRTVSGLQHPGGLNDWMTPWQSLTGLFFIATWQYH